MSQVNIADALVDPEFNETLDRYEPRKTDYFDLVAELVPADWRFRRNNAVWFSCDPPGLLANVLAPQGWKIHVSSIIASAREVLRAVVPVLVSSGIAFKFCVDSEI